jgi:hypothetical protein
MTGKVNSSPSSQYEQSLSCAVHQLLVIARIKGAKKMTDRAMAAEKAARTAKWANTMTKWLISRNKGRTTWQIVSFRGPHGFESRGIVDLLAVRKDHGPPKKGFKRGDLLEIVIIQVKGGSAAWPSTDDILRLRNVGRRFKAKYVVLAVWKKGKQPTFYRMKPALLTNSSDKDAWAQVDVSDVLP